MDNFIRLLAVCFVAIFLQGCVAAPLLATASGAGMAVVGYKGYKKDVDRRQEEDKLRAKQMEFYENQKNGNQGAQPNSINTVSPSTYDSNLVCQAQSYLDRKGYDVKKDCVYGPQTEYAIRNFQKRNNLKVDGSPATLMEQTSTKSQ